MVVVMIHTPSSLLVAGPSGCGKTCFVTQLLGEPSLYFQPVPSTFHYCYRAW